MICIHVILQSSKALEILDLEYWSVGVLKKHIKPLAITPTCPAEVEPVVTKADIPKLIEIESGYDGIARFGSSIAYLSLS